MVRMTVSKRNESKEEPKPNINEGLRRSESGKGDGLVIVRTDEKSVGHSNQSTSIPTESDKTDCPICLTRVDDRAYTDPCLHEFCLFCIEKWSQTSNKCPLCRQTCTSLMHNVRSATEYDRIPVVSRDSHDCNGMLLVDQNISFLLTPVDSGIYMVDERQTPHGIRQNILFLAPNQSFVLHSLNPNTTFVRPENLNHVLTQTDTTNNSAEDTSSGS